jgi:hypothetical protein
VNLVSNLGFGRADATHTVADHPVGNLPLAEMTFPLHHPRFVVRSRSAEKLFERMCVGS